MFIGNHLQINYMNNLKYQFLEHVNGKTIVWLWSANSGDSDYEFTR